MDQQQAAPEMEASVPAEPGESALEGDGPILGLQKAETREQVERTEQVVPAREPSWRSALAWLALPVGLAVFALLSAMAGWWIWRRSRPRRAAASLGLGVATGMLLGVGRMAAGGHFLSDAIWAGWISFATAHVLYFYVLRIPAREDALPPARAATETRPRLGGKAILATCAVAAALLAGGVLWSWRYADLAARLPLGGFPAAPERLEIVADELDVELHLLGAGARQVECSGDVHGFGLPGSRIEAAWSFLPGPVPTLRYRVAEKGWYVYVDATARLRVPWRGLRTIHVRTESGNITVLDETAGGSGAGPRPALDLRTAHGRTLVPPGWETTSDP